MINFVGRCIFAYQNAEHTIDVDDKPKLLLKVYEELLRKLDVVKKAIEEKDYERKFSELSKIEQIIEILNDSLDKSCGQIAENLASLYTYMIRNLRDIHLSLDLKKIEECKSLISTILDGFKKAYEVVQKKESEKKTSSRGQRIVI
ncbi:MAG: flagellar export chaperone FliS [Deltaproteobacteria bacterium]|nr:flagellar export chaperone FliS [Deltaproteobacteria bacterium]